MSIGPVEILQRLVRFDTTNPPGNERACVAWIEELLRGAGLETRLVARAPERPNLVARLPGRGSAPPLLLYGHVDVAATAGQEWRVPPFEGRLLDGWVWGRGALDMKGGVAMMLATLIRARAEGREPPGDVLFCATCDEEGGSFDGARYLVESHPELFAGVRYAISEACYPAYLGGRRIHLVQVAEKQVCWLRATVRGPGGHGGVVTRGGAMARLGRALDRLDRTPLPFHVTPAARLTIEALARAAPALARPLAGALLRPPLTGPALRLLGAQGRRLEPLLRNTASATAVRGGGELLNVVPSEVEIGLDGRLLPGFAPDDLLRELRPVLGPDVGLEVVFHDPGPAGLDLSGFPVLQAILREADPGAAVAPLLLPGCTDARFFARLGIQTYGFLPVLLPAGFDFVPTVHGADERVPADALELGARCLHELLSRLGAPGSD